jgi:hypothetical protein
MQIRRTGPGQFIAAIGGQFTGPVVSQWNSVTGNVTQATGLTTNALFTNVVLSPNAQHAVVTLRVGAGDQFGEAFRSTDGGLSYAPITLPAGVFGLDGAGFINNTTALVLGDSSTVLRVNTATGAVVQLGAAQGIPQKTLDPTTGAVTTFSFIKADFAPNSNIGWVVGSSTVKQPGRSDIVRGVILMSRDGGLTFTRQAIAGAPDNGLGFSDPLEVHALAPDFAALGGTGGVLAARTADTPGNLTECSFTNP